jgi:hypothetical protein
MSSEATAFLHTRRIATLLRSTPGSPTPGQRLASTPNAWSQRLATPGSTPGTPFNAWYTPTGFEKRVNKFA